jgi:hypothetical protein
VENDRNYKDGGSAVNCYGKKHGRTDRCASCELERWCKDAADPKPISDIEYDDSIGTERKEEENEAPETAGSIVDLVETARNHPHLWEVVREKLVAGSAPLSEIAKRTGLKSKQLVQYRLMAFARLCPVVFDAFIFDRRCQKHKASGYYLQRPKWLLSREGRKCRKRDMRTPYLPGMEP